MLVRPLRIHQAEQNRNKLRIELLSKNRISTEKIASNGAYGALGAQEASKNGPKLYILSKLYIISDKNTLVTLLFKAVVKISAILLPLLKVIFHTFMGKTSTK